MIPADCISFNNGRAWVVPQDDFMAGGFRNYDRTCDTCGGNQRIDLPDYNNARCPDCDGTGRHTFTIEVATPESKGFGEFIDTLRVSVVPGMVLPICDFMEAEYPGIVRMTLDRWVLVYPDVDAVSEQITLPPAAAPGMWAVQLKVHNG